MLIVDSQIHVWLANTTERPWAPGNWTAQKAQTAFTKADAMQVMKEGGVDRAIMVPASVEGDRNDLALEAAQSMPNQFAVMGLINAQLPSSRGKVRILRQTPGMLGLRFNLRQPHLQSLLCDGVFEWVWREAEEGSVPVFVYALHSMSHMIDDVARRYPRLRITIDHMGVHSKERDGHAYRDFDRFLALANHPNISTKASALPCTGSEEYPYRNVHPYLRKAYDAFGPKRLFWGVDWTRMKSSTTCTYRQAVTMFTEELGWLTEWDKEWIMGRGICEWLGWPLQQPQTSS